MSDVFLPIQNVYNVTMELTFLGKGFELGTFILPCLCDGWILFPATPRSSTATKSQRAVDFTWPTCLTLRFLLLCSQSLRKHS